MVLHLLGIGEGERKTENGKRKTGVIRVFGVIGVIGIIRVLRVF